MKKINIMITGCAGFIGFHLSNFLANENYNIYGVDNINNYYDVELKKNRLKLLKKNKNFIFYKTNIINKKKISSIIKINKVNIIIHLAAQAGVRYSVDNPEVYFKNNLEGFFNILELSRLHKIKHLVYASSSSVYGDQSQFPTKENYESSKPLSFYAATKKSNEIMAYSYSNIYKLPTTGLRFFTVYGPFGRPDMSLFSFCKSILSLKPIKLYNNGNHIRDFTYIDDILKPIKKIIEKPSLKKIPYEIFNLGNSNPRKIFDYLNIIENELNIKSIRKKIKIQKGDIKKTHSDTSKFRKLYKFKSTSIEIGIKNFVEWYKDFYLKK